MLIVSVFAFVILFPFILNFISDFKRTNHNMKMLELREKRQHELKLAKIKADEDAEKEIKLLKEQNAKYEDVLLNLDRDSLE